MMASDGVDVYVVAGEASGDLHAGNLVKALKALAPGIRLRAMGGPCLRAAGCETSVDLTEFAVMGVLRVLPLVGRFADVINLFRREMIRYRPAAVVLIDYPGLNFLLARTARRLGVPVVYYCCPQLWAWAPWRVKKLRSLADHMLVIFPFEEGFFAGRNARVRYVGHPLCDELARLDGDAMRRTVRAELGVGEGEFLVDLFPGSRRQEVVGLGRYLSEAARRISGTCEGARFAVSCLRERYASLLPDDPMLPVVKGPGEPLMAACDGAIVASGTASLELAFFGKPMAVTYPLARWKQALFRVLSTTPHISTVNLLAGRRLVGEHFLAGRRDVAAVAAELARLIRDREAYAGAVRALAEVRAAYLKPGASEEAARTILDLCGGGER